MIRQRIDVIAFLLILATAWTPADVVHAAGTDVIKNYAIDIQPQQDGSLADSYSINWCVISNSAGPLTWITLGMPTEQYEIVGSSGDVASVRPYNEGFDYRIRIDLPREVYAGDCVNFTVQIHQYGLANLNETANEIGFQFTPGWFNDVPVEHLQVTWHLPSDAAQVKSFNPKPTSQDGAQAVWESDLQPGEKYPISVVYDKAAFPNFNPAQTVPPPANNSSPPEPGPATQAPTTNVDNSAPVLSVPGLVGPLSWTTCACMCVILILVLIVLFVVFRAIGSAGRSYTRRRLFWRIPTRRGLAGWRWRRLQTGRRRCQHSNSPHGRRQRIIRRTRDELRLRFQRLRMRLRRRRPGGLQPQGL